MLTNRRRRSGAMHAESCEEYLQKITEEVDQMIENLHHNPQKISELEIVKEFEFEQDMFTLEPIPFDQDQNLQTKKLKVLLYSIDQQFSPELLDQVLTREQKKQESETRSRTSTSESLTTKNIEILDLDFHHTYIDHPTAGQLSLHFWILNNLTSNYEIFKQIYIELVDIIIIVKQTSQYSSCDFIKNVPENCLVSTYVLNDTSKSQGNSPIKYDEKQYVVSSCTDIHYSIWSILEQVRFTIKQFYFKETQQNVYLIKIQ